MNRPYRNGPPSTPKPGGGWRAGLDPPEQVLLLFASALLATTLVTAAAAQLTARLTDGHWLELDVGSALRAAHTLVNAPGDPATAYSADFAAGLYWTILSLLILAPTAATVIALRARRDRRVHIGSEPARWATRADLKPLIVKRPTPGRLTLGTSHGRLLAAEPGHSLLVMGPTQSGKTTGLAVPAILEWDGPVIATSVKTDLVGDTIQQRMQRGDVSVYDPAGSTTLPGATWSPLAGCRTWAGSLRTATWLTDAAREGTLEDAEFWYANAAKLLAPLLYAAATSGRTMADVVRWVDTQDDLEPRIDLEVAGTTEALNAFEASLGREERARSSVYTTAETVLRCFADPAVAASAVTSEIDGQRLLDGGHHTLYLTAPLQEQARLRPLFTALVQTLLTAAYDRATRSGRLDPPLLLVLDEAANIAPIRDLPQIASTAASLGIQLVTIWQDRAQIAGRYGQAAGTVVNNHRARLLLSGISDLDTTSEVERMLGQAETTRRTTTTDGIGRQNTTISPELQTLVTSANLREQVPFSGILVYGNIPPARLVLRSR